MSEDFTIFNRKVEKRELEEDNFGDLQGIFETCKVSILIKILG